MTEKRIYKKGGGFSAGRGRPAQKGPAVPGNLPAQSGPPARGRASAQKGPAAPGNLPAQSGLPAAAKLLADPPTLEQLEWELKKARYRSNFWQVLRNTALSLMVVAAVSALVAVLFLPVLQIHGASMAPTLREGDVVVGLHAGGYRQGDLVAFYYNNNILIKRVIAAPGDWINIDTNGAVAVNGEMLSEPYISRPALGSCDIDFPYQVPDGRYFVMGDHRETSIDSRSSVMGCIARDMVIGRIMLRAWPVEDFCFFGRG